jgi:hypothetical protein
VQDPPQLRGRAPEAAACANFTGKTSTVFPVAALWTFTISRAPASCTFRRCGRIVSESSVLSDCFTRVVFRVGDVDARFLADGFSSFEARDLQNLDIAFTRER